MAGIRVTVCLAPVEGVDLQIRLDEALAPFEEGYDRHWEREKWDSWYVLGACDGSGFWIAEGADEALLVYDDPDFLGAESPLPGMCAGGPKGLLDLGRPRRDAAGFAAEAWDAWHQWARTMPPALRLAEIEQLSTYADDQRMVFVPIAGIELPERTGRVRAQEVYEAQPLIQAARQMPAWEGIWRGPADYIDYMATEREDYISLAIAQSDRRADILTADGWWAGWHDRPVHALCDSTQTCTHTPPFSEQPEPDELTRYLEQLPDDTFLVHVRAHG